jgi:hypothetical protein
MRSFFLFVTFCALAGLITSLLGLFLFDWSITGTLPYSIVSALLFIQGFTTAFTHSKRLKQFNGLLFTIQFFLCLLYLSEQLSIALIWEWMLLLALIGIQLGIVSIAHTDVDLNFKHKLLIAIGLLSMFGLLLAPIHPVFGLLFLSGMCCSSLLAIVIILTSKKVSH